MSEEYIGNAMASIQQGDISRALHTVKQIPTYDEQREVLSACLFAYAAMRAAENDPDFELFGLHDRGQYERLMRTGYDQQNRHYFYIDPETEEAHLDDEHQQRFMERHLPENDPLVSYYNEIAGKR